MIAMGIHNELSMVNDRTEDLMKDIDNIKLDMKSFYSDFIRETRNIRSESSKDRITRRSSWIQSQTKHRRRW